jgi:hypothetical protein
VSGDEAYLEHIESDNIKKIIDKIYGNTPEDAIKENINIEKHAEIIKQVDTLETPKKSFWKKKIKIF